MYLTIFQILVFTLCFSCSLARNLHSSVFKRNRNAVANRSVLHREEASETKYVFMHHVGSVS